MCKGLLEALDAERCAASAIAVRLSAGRRVQVVASGSIYRFTTAQPLDGSPGDPVMLRLGHREAEGVIAGCDADAVELTLAEDFGPTVAAGAELLLDAPWMSTRLRHRVRDAFEVGYGTPALFNLTNALRTLGIGSIAVTDTGPAPQYEDDRRPLNEAQARAVKIAFRTPLSIVAAPAGTGKTLTLGALVEACYRAGLRTLVTAPSNVAVDLQMVQVCERLSAEPGFHSAAVLRVGRDAGAELRATFGGQVLPDDVTARLRPKLLARVERLQRTVDALAAAVTEAQRECDDDADARIQELRRRLTVARSEMRLVRQDVREYERALASNARVVGATLARVFLDPHLRGFDVAIIDEASMAHAPAVFVAAGLARRHVVVAGDPYQLAAPVRSTGPHRHWLEMDVFQRLGVIRAMRDEEDVPYLTQLTEQRRSATAICELQRALWYGPALRTAPEVVARERARHNVIFGTSALCYVDTSSLDARAYHPWGRTYANDEHARVVADLIAYIDSAGELLDGDARLGEILVLSHYRGQVANIRRLLGDRYRGRSVSVRTVHRAQGAEAATCIVDLTLTRHQLPRTSSVLTATRPEDEGSRLLAVAASRARSRLIVLGDLQWVRRASPPGSVLGRLYHHLVEHGHSISLRDVSGGQPAVQLRVLR